MVNGELVGGADTAAREMHEQGEPQALVNPTGAQ
jgi:glutaredoxin-related protein